MKKAILFDLDGTLIDSTDAILQSFDESFKALNLARPASQSVKDLIGHPLDIMFANLGVKKELVDEAISIYKDNYTKIFLQQTSLIKSAKEAILCAKEIANLAIVTTKSSFHTQILLEHLGIKKYFSAVIVRESVKNPKPNSEPIVKALNLLQISPQNAVMIGDTLLDAMSAKSAGANFVAVLCGYGKISDFDKFGAKSCKYPLDALNFIKFNLF